MYKPIEIVYEKQPTLSTISETARIYTSDFVMCLNMPPTLLMQAFFSDSVKRLRCLSS